MDGVRYDTSAGFPIYPGYSMSLSKFQQNPWDNDRATSWCLTPLYESTYDGENIGTPGRDNPWCR
jgi:hypothetical protein